jgi:4-hydroxysphinganine ceramide fatty acyl 2-hydroxylase
MAVRLWVFGSLWIAAVAWGIAHGERASIPIAMLAGILLWTAIEYLMHRYAFHGFAPHWEHHAEPKDPKFILAPLPLSLSVTAGLWLALWAATRSTAMPGLILSGVWIGYLAYELIHLRVHGNTAGGTLLRALRRYHYHHHFADDTVHYGVTSPLWDLVFRTR